MKEFYCFPVRPIFQLIKKRVFIAAISALIPKKSFILNYFLYLKWICKPVKDVCLEVFFVVFDIKIRLFLVQKTLVVFVPPSCFCYSPYMKQVFRPVSQTTASYAPKDIITITLFSNLARVKILIKETIVMIRYRLHGKTHIVSLDTYSLPKHILHYSYYYHDTNI